MRTNVIFLTLCFLLTACGAPPPVPTATPSPAPTAKILPTNTPLSVDAPAKVLTSENDALPGGLVTALAIDPMTPTTLYAIANSSSLLKSIDGGGHWNLLNAGLANEVIQNLTVDPFTPTHLYILTRKGSLYKSEDSGQNWYKTTLEQAYILAFSSLIPGTVYAVTHSSVNYYKSLDGGKSWNALNGLQGVYTNKLMLDPLKAGTLYAAAEDFDKVNKLYKSTDDGGHWRVISQNIPTTWIDILAADPQKPGSLYVATGNGGLLDWYDHFNSGDLYKSTDSGRSWVGLGLPANYALRTLTIAPLEPAPIFYAILSKTSYTVGKRSLAEITSTGLYKSSDGGQTWSECKQLPEPSGENRGNVLVIDPTHPEIVYIGTQNGVFKSTNSGETWQAANTGLNAALVDKLAIDPLTPSTIYAIYDRGVFKTTNSGRTWRDTHLGVKTTALAIDPVTPGTLYAGTFNKGVFKSTDGGETWRAINQGLKNLHIHNGEGPNGTLVIDPDNPAILYTSASEYNTGAGLYKSTNAGESWSLINSDLTWLPGLIIDPSNANVLHTITHGNNYKSTDAGANWSVTALGNTDANITVLTTTAKNWYVGTDGAGIFKSSDNGQTWLPASQGLPTYKNGDGTFTFFNPISMLVPDPTRPNTLYAGILSEKGIDDGYQQGIGLYRSTDNGNTWQAFVEAGLPLNTWVTDLQFDPLNPAHLYVATYGKGIWSITLEP